MRKNPSILVMGNPPRGKRGKGREFGKQVLEVRYIHSEDGKAYKHPFTKGTRMEALPDGSVRIFHPTKPSWKDFP